MLSLRDGVNNSISNIQTDFHILRTGSLAWPLTVNRSEYDNAYTCSPYTQFITYAKQELWKIHNKPFEMCLSGLASFVGAIFKLGNIDRVVCVNNWLLSTNLYPQIEGWEIKAVKEYLCNAFPEHAILFRSLNSYTNAELMKELEKEGFKLIPSREIFIFDEHLKRFSKRRNTIIDSKLLARHADQMTEHDQITPQDYPRIANLYAQLYGKYSNCSPSFTESFIQLCHQSHFLNMRGIRNHEGQLIAILGSFQKNGVLATPLLGYDISLPLKDGLFRLITAMAMQEALKQNLIFNISGGVSDFKRKRGAVRFIEYLAVYDKHLSLSSRAAWRTLHLVMNYLGVPLLNRFSF